MCSNRAKMTRQPTTLAEKMAIPVARFSHVHVDIVAGLPEGKPAPLVVIPAAKQTYAEAAATPALKRAPKSMCSARVWGHHWWITTRAPTLCWRRAPRSSSCSWRRGMRWSAGTG